MLPCPSIWPPPRKNASTRPCAAQSNTSTAPLVKKLCSCEPRTEILTGGLPSRALRARSNMAPAAGIGDDAPTATCLMPSSKPAMTLIRSSRRSRSPAMALGHLLALRQEAGQVGAKALLGARHRGITRDLGIVDGIFARERQRPGAARGYRDLVDIERGQHARRGILGRHQIALDDALHGDKGPLGRIGHRRQLAVPSDPYIA